MRLHTQAYQHLPRSRKTKERKKPPLEFSHYVTCLTTRWWRTERRSTMRISLMGFSWGLLKPWRIRSSNREVSRFNKMRMNSSSRHGIRTCLDTRFDKTLRTSAGGGATTTCCSRWRCKASMTAWRGWTWTGWRTRRIGASGSSARRRRNSSEDTEHEELNMIVINKDSLIKLIFQLNEYFLKLH